MELYVPRGILTDVVILSGGRVVGGFLGTDVFAGLRCGPGTLPLFYQYF